MERFNLGSMSHLEVKAALVEVQRLLEIQTDIIQQQMVVILRLSQQLEELATEVRRGYDPSRPAP